MDNRFMDKNNVQPSEECNQEVFFSRLYFDVHLFLIDC